MRASSFPPEETVNVRVTWSNPFAGAEVSTRIPCLPSAFSSSFATSRSVRGRSWSSISTTVTSAPNAR